MFDKQRYEIFGSLAKAPGDFFCPRRGVFAAGRGAVGRRVRRNRRGSERRMRDTAAPGMRRVRRSREAGGAGLRNAAGSGEASKVAANRGTKARKGAAGHRMPQASKTFR